MNGDWTPALQFTRPTPHHSALMLQHAVLWWHTTKKANVWIRWGSNTVFRRLLNLLRHAQDLKTPLWAKASTENTWCDAISQRAKLWGVGSHGLPINTKSWAWLSGSWRHVVNEWKNNSKKSICYFGLWDWCLAMATWRNDAMVMSQKIPKLWHTIKQDNKDDRDRLSLTFGFMMPSPIQQT